MPQIESIFVGFFALMLSGIVSFFWWEKQEDKKTLLAHSKSITKVEAQMVDEDKVREIVTEVVSKTFMPIHETLMDIKKLVTANSAEVKQLQVNQALERGYREALHDIKQRNSSGIIH